jgi:hypothetical protein
VDRRFLVLDTALRVSLGRTRVSLDHIDPADIQAIFLGQNPQNLTLTTLVASGQNDDTVAFFDLG